MRVIINKLEKLATTIVGGLVLLMLGAVGNWILWVSSSVHAVANHHASYGDLVEEVKAIDKATLTLLSEVALLKHGLGRSEVEREEMTQLLREIHTNVQN